jgi:hypothetical protein
MAALNATQLLDLSERGRSVGTATRAMLLIAAAFPERSAQSIEALSLGASDKLIASIRIATFGPLLRAQQPCTACNEAFELAVDLRVALDLGLALDLDSGAAEVESSNDQVEHGSGAQAAAGSGSSASPRVRPLTLGDLAAVEQQRDPARALAVLAKRVATDGAGEALDVQTLSEALEQADPDAELQVETACPACGQHQLLSIDLASYLWEEVAQRAPRILRDVAELARTYHWSERDILAMSSARRAFYLGAVH